MSLAASPSPHLDSGYLSSPHRLRPSNDGWGSHPRGGRGGGVPSTGYLRGGVGPYFVLKTHGLSPVLETEQIDVRVKSTGRTLRWKTLGLSPKGHVEPSKDSNKFSNGASIYLP